MAIIFLDTTYFNENDRIIDSGNSELNSENDKLLWYIEKFEKEYLRKLLGDHLYLDLVAHKTDAKYVALATGETYAYDGLNYIYDGFKNMLSYFIFVQYSKDSQSFAAGTGDYQPNMQNSTRIERIQFNKKMIDAFNKGVDLYNDCYNYISRKNSESVIFENWDFTEIRKENIFGI